ncbi:2-hydroxyacid dehydrogenase [Grosmannia clavigera kw1407]|uniref:2-hydroxyacid dehydrogenase n=1 Tax=Grosmannia clavigera (strain kw1407 / UAMH 11150) TaxID=655863 RepID=F0XIB4_GROCL|nr:2-hydroxyacid dehydrogenase [Grosmannia clavigera kw1407]EFX02654.1 2-hydroxyacid dehydrogenase [Grosmannia clavigera kw1407]
MDQPTSTATALASHKLILLSPFALPDDCVPTLTKTFPGLEVVARYQPWDRQTTDLPEEEWRDATILATGSMLPDAELAPKLQYVQLFSAGANHLAEHAVFKDHKVVFCGANGVHGPQIAEWVIATYLSAKHRLAEYRQLQEQNEWRHNSNNLDEAVEDSVGRCVVAAENDAYQPHGLGDPAGDLPDRWFAGTTKADVHAFLGSGLDLLVVALPLTDRTRGLIGADELDLLARHRPAGTSSGSGFFLSNIARGAVVDTDALIAALNDGRIAGAALDVTDPEPLPPGHPLWSARNVTITPHVSGSSTRYLARVLDILTINLGRLRAGQALLLNQLDKKAGY